MAKQNKKKPSDKALIAKYAMLASWSVPATELIKAIKKIILELLK